MGGGIDRPHTDVGVARQTARFLMLRRIKLSSCPYAAARNGVVSDLVCRARAVLARPMHGMPDGAYIMRQPCSRHRTVQLIFSGIVIGTVLRRLVGIVQAVNAIEVSASVVG